MSKFILAAVFCAPLLLVAAPAGDLRMAAEQGDAARGLRAAQLAFWGAAAEQGDAAAQCRLG